MSKQKNKRRELENEAKVVLKNLRISTSGINISAQTVLGYKIAHQNFINTFNVLTTNIVLRIKPLCKWILLLKNNDCR